MNADTSRSLNEIFENGYYRQGQTLGEGGWEFLHSWGVGDWKHYILWDDEVEPVETITAKDDATAIKAFSELYHLEMFGGYEIAEKIVTIRTVKTS